MFNTVGKLTSAHLARGPTPHEGSALAAVGGGEGGEPLWSRVTPDFLGVATVALDHTSASSSFLYLHMIELRSDQIVLICQIILIYSDQIVLICITEF